MQLNSKLALASVLSASALAATNSTSSVPSSCSLGSSATATAQTDLDKYSDCETLVGNLTITGDLGSAALANVKTIDGSLTINNATSLTQFSADAVETITGDLNLQSLTILTSASFGGLQTVDSINLITLPAISTFASNLKSAQNIYISDTSLESIDGFSVLKDVNVFNINNNKYLTSIESSLETVTDSLSFSYNADEAAINFDNLVWANNITVYSVNNASFAKLSNVNASLGFLNNTFTSLSLNALETVGGTFTVTYNDDLTKITANNLTTVSGAFILSNNTDLSQIDGFSSLKTIGGALDVVGNFSTLDLPSLKSVKGGADIETHATNFSCSAFNKLQKSGAIEGDKYVCKNGATSTSVSLSATSTSNSKSSATGSGSNAAASVSSDGSSSSSSSKSSGAAAAQYAPASSFMGFAAAVAVALL
ncbi:hypothetical protein KAFR_0H01260 [Kazachstania africana CBS 2517]|uniref:Receptor L-domain domain-containing protein n=1 Tax=Kazachstania africana (strain ATCC 22294 / BCRC 22015 / CBS 2517 / CECT 1963 / NBRC 1671 / NRRL Y-8276) TaxID=1071382 RepID=H2AYY0_KAZAF|nr:hypothetical protein KAFR_0H01260 [Kazachstania africana CBS 2517]CCF59536.1 hypothetical protein KAFR_0H01260 [Kazachstania africana CBS 2517]